MPAALEGDGQRQWWSMNGTDHRGHLPTRVVGGGAFPRGLCQVQEVPDVGVCSAITSAGRALWTRDEFAVLNRGEHERVSWDVIYELDDRPDLDGRVLHVKITNREWDRLDTDLVDASDHSAIESGPVHKRVVGIDHDRSSEVVDAEAGGNVHPALSASNRTHVEATTDPGTEHKHILLSCEAVCVGNNSRQQFGIYELTEVEVWPYQAHKRGRIRSRTPTGDLGTMRHTARPCRRRRVRTTLGIAGLTEQVRRARCDRATVATSVAQVPARVATVSTGTDDRKWAPVVSASAKLAHHWSSSAAVNAPRLRANAAIRRAAPQLKLLGWKRRLRIVTGRWVTPP